MVGSGFVWVNVRYLGHGQQGHQNKTQYTYYRQST